MLIDEFLPRYDARERHSIEVNAATSEVYRAVRQTNFQKANLTKFLFKLRGISSSESFSLEDYLKMRFVILGERPDEEILLGLTGKFWKPSGDLIRVEAQDFVRFNRAGYAKAVWNFSLGKTTDGAVRLQTETRVLCTDAASRSLFRVYWFFIGFFSGAIRREMLGVIKKSAEEKHQ